MRNGTRSDALVVRGHGHWREAWSENRNQIAINKTLSKSYRDRVNLGTSFPRLFFECGSKLRITSRDKRITKRRLSIESDLEKHGHENIYGPGQALCLPFAAASAFPV